MGMVLARKGPLGFSPVSSPNPTQAGSLCFPDSAIGAVVGRIHTYRCGLWFNSPVDAKNAGALATVTPFNGEGNAEVQVLNTANFPDLADPLAFVR
jgi:hypothetical protein